MRQIDLEEYQASQSIPLTVVERDALMELSGAGLNIELVKGEVDKYTLTPGSTVGNVHIGELDIRIRPKIGMPQLLSLASYALNKVKFQGEFDFDPETSLPDALAIALNSAARFAFGRGLLHGYINREEALHTVRGRIKFSEQIRRRFGIPLPVEVSYDEFTDDILSNRLIKAAAYRLSRVRLRSSRARRGLGWISGMLANVSQTSFPPNKVPEVSFDRLNQYYQDVVTLSRLILSHGAFQTERGGVRTSGFLMDMNQVFQEFVTRALQEALGVSERTFRETGICSLDLSDTGQGQGRVHLRPDLTWWDGGVCNFVGDAKYKRITDSYVPNADLYQLLAYVTALDLPGGLLIYAKGEADTATYQVRHTCKRLKVSALDLSGTLDEVLIRVNVLAGEVKKLRAEARAAMTVA